MKQFLTALLAAAFLAALPSCQVLAPGRKEVSQPAPGFAQARQAWHVLQRESPGSDAARDALLIYNQAVFAIVKSLRETEGTAAWGKTLQLGGSRPLRIAVDARGSERIFALRDFSKCELAAEVTLTGFDRVVAHDGLGVPVVLGQDDPKRVAQSFHPPGGEFLPATAVLEFPPSGARLRFYNPLAVTKANVGPYPHALANNLTAALQRSLTNAISDEENPRPSASGEVESQLFFLNRYDKSKIPVVFVHGLLCGPDVWKNSANELLADPDLRRRYQPVCFMYPTKLPIPVTAARLRELLKRSREKLDPARQNPGYGRVVLVGHSMGGLVSRMQVIDSGNDFWHAFFVASPRKVARRIDVKTRQMVNGALFFKRESNVKRVIFISTPHLGSDLADIGAFQSILRVVMFIPKTARQSVQALVDLPAEFVQPILRDFHGQGVEGTENLSTRHPFFGALAEHRPEVPFHSIIATRGQLDFRNGGDGVVPYTSAHLDGAITETTVPYTHGCLEKPDTVQAVMKILKDAR